MFQNQKIRQPVHPVGRSPYRRKHTFRKFGIVLIAAFLLVGVVRLTSRDASADTGLKVKSGMAGYCLDDHTDNLVNGNPVDAWSCNGTSAQSWTISYDQIRHNAKYCLSVETNGKEPDSKVELDSCNSAPGQIWLKDKSGYINPNSGLCLAADPSNLSSQLAIASCDNLASQSESWTPEDYSGKVVALPTCGGTEGQKVACEAATEWAHWQGSNNHEALLNTYTGGTPYEEWCADFVSYIYKQAGYPLTSAYDGWDENDANNLQNYPEFTEHQASSGYVPKAGDIAWFNYDGGHVEIVISGGKQPTFVYGNSGEIDPTTGNGEMRTNTLTSDGSEGQLVYYLSPNS